MEQPAPKPGVKVRTPADERAIQVAGKLAAGAAEALELAPGPARRLSSIAIEATRNVVQHAYVDLDPGDVEIALTANRGAAPDGRDEILLTVRDFGAGCPLAPTSKDPPGLGLSMVSELSEAMYLNSAKHRGTEIGATIRVPGNDDESEPRVPASRGSRIDFIDPEFLAPVIPRAIAVHAAGGGASVDAVRLAIAGGRGIADCIDRDAIAADGGTISIDQADGSDDLDVWMGPMPTSSGEPLLTRLRSRLDGAQPCRMEPDDREGCRVLVTMSLL
jgi:anti-sigma regulatory factor (Ser/Thr protein kinase)